MKALLYSPYIPKHFGGGEKYILDVAEILQRHHYEVFVTVQHPTSVFSHNQLEAIKKQYQDFFNLDLAAVKFINSKFDAFHTWLEKLLWTKEFDLFYHLTDGSLRLSLSKKKVLHIQFPLILDKSSLLEQIKLLNYQVKNTNSIFTKSVVEKYWPVKISEVHQPAVDLDELKTKFASKENIVLTVGRFFQQLHSKRQDVMVDVFKQLRSKNKTLKTWRLVMVGGVEDAEYLHQVQNRAAGLPVEFLTNLNRAKLVSLYKKAKIYWHAAGFGVDQELHPEKVEHFGISTLEAMAAGCVPVVVGKGGQPEILGEELGRLLWQTKTDCRKITSRLVSDASELKTLSSLATQRAAQFSKEIFEEKLLKMVK